MLLAGVAGGLVLLRDAPRSGTSERTGRASSDADGRHAAGGGSRFPAYYSTVESGKVFRSLADRRADPRPLTLAEVFRGRAKTPSYGGVRLSLRETQLDTDCSSAVWGAGLVKDLERNGCNQVLRGGYVDARGRMVGMVAIFNMKDVEGATTIIEVLDPEHERGFVRPLDNVTPLGRLGSGYSEAYAHAMGHYVFLRWAQRVDGATPRPRTGSAISDTNVALTDAQQAIRRRARRPA